MLKPVDRFLEPLLDGTVQSPNTLPDFLLVLWIVYVLRSHDDPFNGNFLQFLLPYVLINIISL